MALSGCGPNVCLVDDVPAPLFGAQRQGIQYRSGGATQPTGGRSATPATVAWTPSVAERRWRFIVVHHSATTNGDAAAFDRAHRARGWDELGYHFVVGNGSLSRDGQLEVGSRWRKQKHGAHAKVRGHPEYNQLGVGICLVGNFNNAPPGEAQMQTLARLIRGLMTRYNIPKSRVLGHGMLAPTDCPGKQFNFRDLYRRL